jgi:hypothetical protein
MPRDETRSKLSLPIESVEQSGTELVRIGGQVIEKSKSGRCISYSASEGPTQGIQQNRTP